MHTFLLHCDSHSVPAISAPVLLSYIHQPFAAVWLHNVMHYSCLPHSGKRLFLLLLTYLHDSKTCSPVKRHSPNSTSLSFPLISVLPPFSPPPNVASVTTSLRRRQCSFRRKTMKALALSLGEPKVSYNHFCSSITFFTFVFSNVSFILSQNCSFVLCSPNSHRGVHSDASVPCAAVPGVCRWGGRGLEGRPEDGGFSHRGKDGSWCFALT